jgi:hypothetical protein
MFEEYEYDRTGQYVAKFENKTPYSLNIESIDVDPGNLNQMPPKIKKGLRNIAIITTILVVLDIVALFLVFNPSVFRDIGDWLVHGVIDFWILTGISE